MIGTMNAWSKCYNLDITLGMPPSLFSVYAGPVTCQSASQRGDTSDTGEPWTPRRSVSPDFPLTQKRVLVRIPAPQLSRVPAGTGVPCLTGVHLSRRI
ncbi:hypothetical protein RRG08_041193 [Elysia crispata]|uniref:Uncharacterized protein n=1 Tax=Elysia crispata TaxID=231223 RepID=A0AAE1CP07_9GAST|nr:hypothetical protein RRG08_041193 [Elysia crispata]